MKRAGTWIPAAVSTMVSLLEFELFDAKLEVVVTGSVVEVSCKSMSISTSMSMNMSMGTSTSMSMSMSMIKSLYVEVPVGDQ